MTDDTNDDIPKDILIGTISLICAILFFSGILKDFLGGIFDFAKISGAFNPDLKLSGGIGAKGGFAFALSLAPSVMLALGAIAVFEHFKALKAAEYWLNKILQKIMGVPGVAAVSLIASLQSTDAGSSTTKFLHNEKKISDKELLTFAAFQFSAGAALTNFLGTFGPLIETYKAPTSIAACLGIILLFKIIGANLMRLYIEKFVKGVENE